MTDETKDQRVRGMTTHEALQDHFGVRGAAIIEQSIRAIVPEFLENQMKGQQTVTMGNFQVQTDAGVPQNKAGIVQDGNLIAVMELTPELARKIAPAPDPRPIVGMRDRDGGIHGPASVGWADVVSDGDPTSPADWDKAWPNDAPHSPVYTHEPVAEPEGLEVLRRRSWQAKGGRAVYLHDVRGMLAEKDAAIDSWKKEEVVTAEITTDLMSKVAELQEEVERLRRERDDYCRGMEANGAAFRTHRDEVQRLRARIAELEARLEPEGEDTPEEKLAYADGECAMLREKLAELEAREVTLKVIVEVFEELGWTDTRRAGAAGRFYAALRSNREGESCRS